MEADGCRNSRGVGCCVLAAVGRHVLRVPYQLHRLSQNEHDALLGDGLRTADEHPGERHVEQRQAADHGACGDDCHGCACCRGRLPLRELGAVAGAGAGAGGGFGRRRRVSGPAAKACRAPLAPGPSRGGRSTNACCLRLVTMEKHNNLSLSEHCAATGPRDGERPRAAPKSRAVHSAVFAIVICLGLARVFGVFAPTERAPPSIAERAKTILKENPLIGQSACACAQQ
jgi:hypothetical protein